MLYQSQDTVTTFQMEAITFRLQCVYLVEWCAHEHRNASVDNSGNGLPVLVTSFRYQIEINNALCGSLARFTVSHTYGYRYFQPES